MHAEIKDAVKRRGHDIVFISSGRVSCDSRKGGRVKKSRANAAMNTNPAMYSSDETGVDKVEEGTSIQDLISFFCLIACCFFFLAKETETCSMSTIQLISLRVLHRLV